MNFSVLHSVAVTLCGGASARALVSRRSCAWRGALVAGALWLRRLCACEGEGFAGALRSRGAGLAGERVIGRLALCLE